MSGKENENNGSDVIEIDGQTIELNDEEGKHHQPQEKSSLSEEQLEILHKVQQGQNIFITGSAGVGKSFVLKEIIKILPPESTYVTASTGVAACNISGITLHSFAGIGLGDSPITKLIRRVRNKREASRRWIECSALVIDEISMIDGELFEKVEEIARKIRGNESPFGGIQLIVCGDFLQLPPVQKDNDTKKFCFEVPAWNRCVQTTVLLEKIFRQKEEKLIGMLNRIRIGELTRQDCAQLQKSNFTKFNQDDGIKPTRLFPHRAPCDRVNEQQLASLPGPKYEYRSDDRGREEFQQQLNKYSRFPKVIPLKVGAQVMLMKNLNVSSGLVNGSRGVVTGFISAKEQALKNVAEDDEELAADLEKVMSADEKNLVRYPIVKFTNGTEMVLRREKSTIEIAGLEVASRDQIPLALAWAVSIHKSQGMTLERVELSLSHAFEYGQAYVALSRCTSLSGLKVSDFRASVVKAHPKVLAYYKNLRETPVIKATRTQGCGAQKMANMNTGLFRDLEARKETFDSQKMDMTSVLRRDLESRSKETSPRTGHLTINYQSDTTFVNGLKTLSDRNFKGYFQNSPSNRTKLFVNDNQQENSKKAFFQPMKRPYSFDSDSGPKLKQRKNNLPEDMHANISDSMVNCNKFQKLDSEFNRNIIVID